MLLNPDAVTPLYKQMEDLLMERIASGEFQPGDRLPSVEELANECGVSVVTVRRAIDNLSQKDVVTKKQGKGTYVNAWVFRRNFSQVLSFTEACRLNNTKPGARVLALEILDSMEDVTEKLERIGENRVIHVQRLRLVDDKPISIETNYFPMSFAYLLEEDLNDTSLFEIIRRRTGIEIAHSRREFQVCRANETEAELLQIGVGMPLLLVDSVAYTSDYKPVYVGKQVISTEDYRFTI